MQLEGMNAVFFVLAILILGYLIGMVHAGWIIVIRMRAQGYRLNERLELIASISAPAETVNEEEANDQA